MSFLDEKDVWFTKDSWDLIAERAARRNMTPEELITQALVEYLQHEDEEGQ